MTLRSHPIDSPLRASPSDVRQMVQEVRAEERERPWTVSEAAHWLQFDEETIRRWARSKKLPGEKVAGEWRFAPGDVRAFLPRTAQRSRVAEDAATLKAQLDAAYAKSVLRGRTA